MKDVSIIIVNYNTRDLLRRCLTEAFKAAQGLRTEIFVVDNASSDGSAEMVRKDFPSAKLLANPENRGFAAANNQALRLMDARFALLLNSDALLKEDTLKKLLAFAERTPRAAVTGPRLITGDGALQPSTYPLPSLWLELLSSLKVNKLLPAGLNAKLFLSSFFDHRTSRRAGRLTGACALVRREAIEAAGVMSEEFFFYGEFHDWCWRIIEKGWEVWFCAEAEAVHLGGQSSSLKWTPAERRAVNLREEERMLAKHLDTFSKWCFMAMRLGSDAGALFYRSIAGGDAQETAAIRDEAAWFLSRFKETGGWFLRQSAPARLYYASCLHKRSFTRRLAAISGSSPEEILAMMEESAPVREGILAAWAALPGKPARSGMLDFASAEFIYALVRLLKPAKVTETGVANGISSCFILAAMDKNAAGRLVSVDFMPPGGPSFLPAGKDPGWLVPEGLRSRWELVYGRTSEKLPPLLERDAPIDVFIHDSEHTYANMKFEYAEAWPRLKDGGLLLSDDIGFNRAFAELAERTGSRYAGYADKLGVMRKKVREP
jgi:GT2 family glycosyltransferase/predicted O-methyltransferase YrrM